jgi:preprotein translocase subunit SecE
VARDRQRSKQRRQRRSSQGGGNPAGERARDIGLDDATIDESGLTDTAPAPDPLKNASGYADEARAAETGAHPPDEPAGEAELREDDLFPEGSEDELDRAPDAVEEPGLAARGGSGSGGGGGGRPGDLETSGGRSPEHQGGNKVVAFIRACVDELRRVQWPDRKHVFQATAVVLGFVLVAGGWLGLMDAIWQPLINAII